MRALDEPRGGGAARAVWAAVGATLLGFACDRADATPEPRGAASASALAPAPTSAAPPTGTPRASATSAAPSTAAPVDALTEKRLRDAAVAIDSGRYDSAVVLLDQLAAAQPLDVQLLRARLALLVDDPIGALRELEAARRAAPKRVDVCATAAEIYCALGRLDAAEEEIRAGLALEAEAPELLRARAALALSRPGQGEAGLALLERALAQRPELAFSTHLLREARLLAARAKLQRKDAAGALALARAVEAADPGQPDARAIEADARAALGDLDGACQVLEALRADGLDPGAALATLHQRAAMLSLIESKRDTALDHFARARELGASDAELGTGAELLFEAAVAATRAGVDAYGKSELGAARTHFERALRLDPGAIEARNHLAVVDFRDARYAQAAAGWKRVVEQARAERLPLPEPVHLNLARAYERAGALGSARLALEDYLRDAPDGEWIEQTRAELAKLPPAPLLSDPPSKG